MVVVAVHAEQPGGASQQVPRQLPQGHRLGHIISFDHIPEQGRVDVATQQLQAVAGVGALGLGKPSLEEVGAQVLHEG